MVCTLFIFLAYKTSIINVVLKHIRPRQVSLDEPLQTDNKYYATIQTIKAFRSS